uniref:Uncharacterized protein n=1 Tax=Halalkalibacterium halodurans TaxID=86665 RepID=A0A0M0KJC3_ALKHA
MFIRLTQTRFSDCCPGSSAVVYDTDSDSAYCLECWGQMLHAEHPDYVKRSKKVEEGSNQ